MNPTLRRNDKGEWVEYLQLLLGRADYETGKIDGDFGGITEGAVHQYQRDHRLLGVTGVVDDMFWQSIESSVGEQTGLRDPHLIDEYVEDTIGIANTGTSAEDRRAALEAAVNERLASVGVPYVSFELNAPKARGALAAFRPRHWVVALNPPRFEPAAVGWATPEQQAALLGTVYHEARHAEQYYRIARYLAGFGYTAGEIADAPYRIAAVAAEAAVADPLLAGGPEFEEAAAWYDGIFGSGAAQHDAAYKTGTAADRRVLPEELDAHDTRGLVVEEFLDEQSGDARPELRRGLYNRDQVAYLQQTLEYLGYELGAIDGDFGDRTFAAVQQFQHDHDIPDTGVVDRETWAALDRARGF